MTTVQSLFTEGCSASLIRYVHGEEASVVIGAVLNPICLFLWDFFSYICSRKDCEQQVAEFRLLAEAEDLHGHMDNCNCERDASKYKSLGTFQHTYHLRTERNGST